MAGNSSPHPVSLDALFEALADACRTAQSSVGLYDSRHVTFVVDRSTIEPSKSGGGLHAEAIGEMRSDFGIEAGRERPQRETGEPVRLTLDALSGPTAVEFPEDSEATVGWLVGCWASKKCAFVQAHGRARPRAELALAATSFSSPDFPRRTPHPR